MAVNSKKKTVSGLSITALAVSMIAGTATQAQPYGQNLNGAYDARGSYTSLDRGNAAAAGPNTGRTDALGQPASFDRADDGSLAALFAAQNAVANPAPAVRPSADDAKSRPAPPSPDVKSDASPQAAPAPK